MSFKISFHYQVPGFRLRQATRLRKWLGEVANQHKREVSELTYVFVSDEALLEMNRLHLQHDYYTDIITFDLGLERQRIEGELYISVDRVRENAEMNGCSNATEMRRIMAHGLLHLCGLGDKSASEATEMRQAEDLALQLF